MYDKQQKAQYGGIVVALGLEEDLEGYARDIGVVERDLLWAQHEGMHVPTYVLAGLRDAVEAYRERLTRLGTGPVRPA
ncbi:hypothetical protein GCM10025868_26110 [Angustibacter aerolatus]|uniref:Uncharacterized protein n=1 Tax=Angustibacter aerolatus TaxID=1162965 RepID=A0ABQ6JII1_9ACTN|nr:hypothetical protein GCM10025868_26110 [Angustibacter aerolatus]